MREVASFLAMTVGSGVCVYFEGSYLKPPNEQTSNGQTPNEQTSNEQTAEGELET